ncbi:hypothetical protein [Methyloradius palustris]|uniref:FixH family protein n=1 Tax=Methyloradius palustris TaxID=2778876 RepID=A0A8D5GFL6_9PROT|nr:hypothetical protein [Methyloradius palustris]BCM25839.1 hypothetical protein ZMTM_20980 [Methyloradius palustris]
MTNRLKWVVKAAACCLLIFALVAVYYVQSQYSRAAFNDVPIEHVTCDDLVRGCDVDDVHIRFDRQPQVMQPFHLYLQTVDAQGVSASFAMVGMQMGLNRYRFLQQSPENWIAEIILPICVQSRSDWLVDIEITKPHATKRYQLSFTSSGGQARLRQPE